MSAPQLKRDPLGGGPRGVQVFTSQGQAKRFFVDKIVAQAVREGHPLSESGLAVRAYAADIASNPDAGPTYREAFHVLNQGDHYILMMLEGLSRRLRPWWAFWR